MPSIANRPESVIRELTLILMLALSFGCEQKKKVLDIEAPGVDIEIHKTEGGIEVESKSKRNK